ncbi:MAG: enhanced serine sensitivity protein SseB C-terminal domain-containing protein [Myxococcota bacterium]
MSDFVPENDLERALVAAANDPASEPQFYRTLPDSKLFVMDHSAEQWPAGESITDAPRALSLGRVDIDGVPHVPVFSALSRLQSFVKVPGSQIGLAARVLLCALRGSYVALNPGSVYGKSLAPREISELLDGSIFSAQSRLPSSSHQVFFGQPAQYPHHLIDPLKRLFASRQDVRAAYLAHYYDPTREEPAHTLIGVDASGDWKSVVGDAVLVLRRVRRQGEIVDFIPIAEDDGRSRYMVEQTSPFFQR